MLQFQKPKNIGSLTSILLVLIKKNCKTHYSRERLQFSSMLLQVQETQCQEANL